MTIRGLLLSSAAIVAVSGASAVATPANRFPEWYFAAEGAALFTDPTVNTEAVTPPPVLGKETGGSGALMLGGAIDGARDWRIRLAYSAFDNRASVTPGSTYELTSHYSITAADFEAGFQRADEAGEFRLAAGLRALAVSEASTEDKVGTGGADNQLNAEFIGIGPRLALSFDRRMADTPWGWSGAVAGSAVFGQRSIVAPSTVALEISTQSIFNAEAAVGLDYHPTATSVVTLGVRGERWWNLRAAYESTGLTVKSDILDWGPFVRWTFSAPP